jgi:hypothetical protein
MTVAVFHWLLPKAKPKSKKKSHFYIKGKLRPFKIKKCPQSIYSIESTTRCTRICMYSLFHHVFSTCFGRFVFVICVGPAVTHRMYCSLSWLIVLTRFSFPLSSPEAYHVNQRERPLSAKGGTIGEKYPIKFSHTIATFTVIVGLFYMPQICDMGPTDLLPHRRKACWGFFRPKNPTASAGFEPANLGTRGQDVNHYVNEVAFLVLFTPIIRSTNLRAQPNYAWLLWYVRSWIIHWSRFWLGHPHTFSTVEWNK